jgi:hypothetical protein
MNFFKRKPEEEADSYATAEVIAEEELVHAAKSKWQKLFPVLAAGSGLFSEGYVQSV